MQQLALCVSDVIRLKSAIKTSERLRREQQDFTYAISHDLLTAANTVRMIMDEVALEKDKLSEDNQELLGDGFKALERMGDQIEDVVAYSQTVHREKPHELLDLSEIAKVAAADLYAAATKSGAAIDIGDLPTVTGDSTQLRSVFQHLIGNGIKYARQGVPPVVRVWSEDTDDDQLTIHVQDNGIGIAEQHQAKVFELFKRLHLKTEFPGSGIGLTLCRRVIHNHHGRLILASDVKTGTTITIKLPKLTS